MRSLLNHEPILTIDQEGGRVSRLKVFGSEPPSAKDLGEKGDIALLRTHGELTGKLLRLFGLNYNLAPVLDFETAEQEHNSLKGRTFAANPQSVCSFAKAFIEGIHSQGILCCGKHFPGYSFAQCDPHLELPQVFKTKKELEAYEWVPFKNLQYLCDSFMIAHIRNLNLDPEGLPASLSFRTIHDVLRKEWNYTKLLLSDDIDMGAIIHHYSLKDTLELSLKAGIDLLLLCHRFPLIREAASILSSLPETIKEAAWQRIENFRKRLAPPLPFSLSEFQSIDSEIYSLREKVLGKERAKLRAPEDGKRSPVEIY
ncbi:glycoside hydrolase family 3 N-terminal domain-containing protein [Methylacidiphilum kamchatkense]|uniref:glycoside hydrolase family 3 N-terminal domain-containing protein n=1 Tax=Methylacidiphilum kamchatkense TaxID=431057 RepID=UPI000A5CD231|nr:glycoside hydrolase family 3 N-terminal domain-containing protein [Methylacidiphilum kamchatkense]